MWLERRLKRLTSEKHPVLFTASDEWGVPYLIHALNSEQKPLVWLKLDASRANDAVAQGNKLSDALTRALATPLFGYGMHYNYAVALIRNHLPLLGPFTFALSGAEHGMGLARELLTLHGNKNTVILHFESEASFAAPDNAVLLDKDFLRVTEKEAKELSDGFFDKRQLSDMVQTSEGAFELFSITLSQQRSVPVPLRPTPEGLITPPSVEEITVDPNALIDALIHRKRWMEAFETAVRHAPQRVPEVMEEAGHIYHERGLHKRLWQLLLQLPEDLEPDESILFCKLQAAFRINESESVRKDVEAFLEVHEAPRLRALYAGVFAYLETSLDEARRAYEHLKSPLTLYMYGHILLVSRHDVHMAIQILEESTKLAKEVGRTYDFIRNTMRFADALSTFGNYRAAFHYTKLALNTFYQENLGDWQRYLELINNYCYFQLLTGNEQGIFEKLIQNEKMLNEINSSLAYFYRSTLGDYFLVVGQTKQALVYYEDNLTRAEEYLAPDAMLHVINALIVDKRYEEALRIAEKLHFLSKESDITAKLGYGMILALSNPEAALSYLEGCYEVYHSFPFALNCAKASMFLARAYLTLGEKSKALSIIDKAKPYLSELSPIGLQLLSGSSDTFNEVWELTQQDTRPVYITCLGSGEVYLRGEKVPMPLRSSRLSFCWRAIQTA
jgi:hypothetical protein